MKNYDTEKTTKNYDLEKTALDPPDLPPKNYPSSLLLPRPESLLTEANSLNMCPGCSHELSPKPLKVGPPTILTTLYRFMFHVLPEQGRLLPGDKI